MIRDGKEKVLTVSLKEQNLAATSAAPDNGAAPDAAPAATQKFLPGVEIDDFDGDGHASSSPPSITPTA